MYKNTELSCLERIDDLAEEEMLSEDLFDELFSVSDVVERVRLETRLGQRAKILHIKTAFEKILRQYEKEYREYERRGLFSVIDGNRSKGIELQTDSKTGAIRNTIENYLRILREDKRFDDIKYNLLKNQPERTTEGNLYNWSDTDDSEVRHYIEVRYGIHDQKRLKDALRIVFREREYHPIKDIIENLKWDGVPRIENLLIKWLGCENNEYSKEVSRLIFAGGINRLYRPGCKFDDMPVLIGTRQGEGKSSFIRWLNMKDDFFNEVKTFEGNKAIESLRGFWVCEVSEMLALKKQKEQEAAKAFLTTQSDYYRRPYAEYPEQYPRQCIFVGSTNTAQFLTDKTGNRRYYPIRVECSGYDLFNNEKAIRADIEQCWAEAYHYFKQDNNLMKPYAKRDLLTVIEHVREAATEDDFRVGMVSEYVEYRSSVCIIELWEKALGFPSDRLTRKDSNELALILRSLGWDADRNPTRVQGYGKQKCWHPAGVQVDAGFVDEPVF